METEGTAASSTCWQSLVRPRVGFWVFYIFYFTQTNLTLFDLTLQTKLIQTTSLDPFDNIIWAAWETVQITGFLNDTAFLWMGFRGHLRPLLFICMKMIIKDNEKQWALTRCHHILPIFRHRGKKQKEKQEQGILNNNHKIVFFKPLNDSHLPFLQAFSLNCKIFSSLPQHCVFPLLPPFHQMGARQGVNK